LKEQENHKKAFEFYYGLGEGRSYRLVAEEFGVSLATVKVWGKSFTWKDRVRDRDANAARAMADDNLKSSAEKTARNRKIVEMGLIQVAKAIAEGKVKPTISDLDRLVRLEEFLRKGAVAQEGEESLLERIKREYAARHKDKGCA
jgi:transposase